MRMTVHSRSLMRAIAFRLQVHWILKTVSNSNSFLSDHAVIIITVRRVTEDILPHGQIGSLGLKVVKKRNLQIQ